MLKTFISLALFSVSFSGAVFAADVIDPTTSYDWSGFYLGVQGGYDFGSATHAFSNGAPSDNSNPQGIAGGVHAGYNWHASKILFGLEADAEVAGVNGSFNNTTGGTSSGASHLYSDESLRLRLGLPIDRILPYVTGGVALGQVRFEGGPAGGPCCGFNSSPLGYTLGAGIDYAVSNNLSARLEYRFTDYGTSTGGLAPTFPSVSMPTHLQTNAVMVGLSYKF